MEIRIISSNKKIFLSLLLIGDEQEEMVLSYMNKGNMFVIFDPNPVGIAIVIPINNNSCEIKNISIDPAFQNKRYGSTLIKYIINHYQNIYETIIVGTGANTKTVSFYEKLGFTKSHCISNFFIDNYDHLMFEDDIQLIDMQYLELHV